MRHTPIPCPVCRRPLTRVIETRPYQHTIKRRRECPNGHRATTREALEVRTPDMVVEAA